MQEQKMFGTCRAKKDIAELIGDDQSWYCGVPDGGDFIQVVGDENAKVKPDLQKYNAMRTDELLEINQNPTKRERAQQQNTQKDTGRKSSATSSSSLKLHISLNDIGEISAQTILQLIVKLKQVFSEDEENIQCNTFKIIRPEKVSPQKEENRFSNTDQITIFLNKYTSIYAIHLLCNKINEFLLGEKFKNAINSKDKITLNQFVSARFDTDPVNQFYGNYDFFDIEINKFLQCFTGKEQLLEKVPLYFFESVFAQIITSNEINLNKNNASQLSDAESKIVQRVFSETAKKFSFEYQPVQEKRHIVDDENPLKSLKSKLHYSYAVTENGNGRWHLFSVASKSSSLRWDALKTEILSKFKIELDEKSSIYDLNAYVAKFKTEDDYKILNTCQDIRIWRKTSAAKALEEMIDEKLENLKSTN